MFRHQLLTAAMLAFVACGGGTSKDGTGTGTGGTGTGDATGGTGPTVGDSGGGGGGGGSWEPVAVGFELIGGIHPGNTLGPWTTGTAGPYDQPPFVVLTLASIDYFSGDTDESCDMIALIEPEGGFPTDFDFMYPPEDPGFTVEQMANKSDVGWTGDPETASDVPYVTWTGRLVLDPVDDHCEGVIEGPSTWTQAPGAEGELPHEPFQNMKIGFQIGQHTDYLLSGWITTPTDWDDYGDAMMAMYIGINYADGFHGEDWTTARFWEADDIHQAEVDADSFLIPSEAKPNNLRIGEELPHAYLNGQPRWYQDFPLMDFPNLAD